MESGLLYIAAVIVMIAIGFIFALFVSMFVIREADRAWPQDVAVATSLDETAHAESAEQISPTAAA